MAHRTLNLNGKTIAKQNTTDDWYCVVVNGQDVEGQATLDIKGNGTVTVEGTGHEIALTARQKGVMNIYNGNFIGSVFAGEVIYTLKDGKCNIYGGNFYTMGWNDAVVKESVPETEADHMILVDGDLYAGCKWSGQDYYGKAYWPCYMINVQNDDQTTNVKVYGGKFYGWNPEMGDDRTPVSFVADGYKVVKSKEATTNGYINVYTVVKA